MKLEELCLLQNVLKFAIDFILKDIAVSNIGKAENLIDV